ncbi:hypothetical protein ACTJJ0_29785 [Chitinophaga sp. 22321]|uniref:Uncharacterized protein n=1 Tax=Chitinophaga hostae TaxID=2831022 RepID=A0ABS5J7J4_9BACT|nr:hypothetical protein [Chitinophaga hostae]MBS0031190.1 hypothetical protein [Chitinophaga hostae]
MKYLNPLTLLDKMNGGPVDVRDNTALTLLRKKMLAGLDLTDDKALQVNGQLFNKHELLQFFDRLQSTDILRFHQQVAADAVLVHFLKTGEMKGQLADQPWYEDPGFLVFIAPYYEPLFTAAVLNSLQQADVAATQHLFAAPLLMDGAHTTASYRQILRHLKGWENELKTALAELDNGAAFTWKYLAHLANTKLIQQLNSLPAEFHQWRIDYSISLINLAIAIYTKDFKRSMAVLDLVSQLQTSDYVQERVVIRRAELQQLRKQQLHKRPAETWLGRLIKPFWPAWLTEKKAYLIFFCLLLGIGIVLDIRDQSGRKNSKSVPSHNVDFFAGSRTGAQMKYLVAQLQHMVPGQLQDTPVKDSGLLAPQTGTDVYGPAFMGVLKPGKLPGAAKANGDEQTYSAAAIDSAAFLDPLHKQSVKLYNRLPAGLVALVQTPDSLYSRFVAPHDSVFLPLLAGIANRLYFYAGENWTISKQSGTPYDSTYRVNGFFMSPYKNSAVFLTETALVYTLDPAYWRRSNRYIPLEINTEGDHLFLNMMDNDATGVDLYLGE